MLPLSSGDLHTSQVGELPTSLGTLLLQHRVMDRKEHFTRSQKAEGPGLFCLWNLGVSLTLRRVSASLSVKRDSGL